jgi:hypothetical protein
VALFVIKSQESSNLHISSLDHITIQIDLHILTSSCQVTRYRVTVQSIIFIPFLLHPAYDARTSIGVSSEESFLSSVDS